MQKKILIIEDESLIRKSLQKLLLNRGVAVDTAIKGKEAIELLLSNDYQRIVCDLMLQDITGFDIIEASKSKYTKEMIRDKFIIMTAYSSSQVLLRAKEYHCTILNKPFIEIDQTLDLIIGEEREKKD